MGEFWPSSQGPNCPKLGLRGVLGLFNPPLSNIVYLVILPNLGVNYYCTRVCRTHLEVIWHLLNVHACVYVPLGEIHTLQDPTLSATKSLHQLVVVGKQLCWAILQLHLVRSLSISLAPVLHACRESGTFFPPTLSINWL